MNLMSRFNDRIQTRDNSWHVVSTDIIGNDILSKRQLEPYVKNNTFFLLHFAGAFLEWFYECSVFEIRVRSQCRESKYWQDDVPSGYNVRSMLRSHISIYTCNSTHLNSTWVDAAACSCQRKEAASEREIRHFFIDRFVTYIQERLNLQTQEKNTS